MESKSLDEEKSLLKFRSNGHTVRGTGAVYILELDGCAVKLTATVIKS